LSGRLALLPIAGVAGPVGLEEVPLVRRSTDEPLELVGQRLGDADDVVAEAAGSLERERGTDHAEVAVAPLEVDGRRQQGGAGAQRERGRAGREAGALAEELDLDRASADVAVGQQRQ